MKRLNLVLIASVATLGVPAAAQAADLMISEPAPMMSEPAMAPAGGWDGPYIGVFGGFGSGFADHKPATSSADGNDIDLSGALLGVDVGANFYLSDKVVGGIAGDIAWSNVGGSISPANFPFNNSYDEIQHTIDWQGSIRGVLGFDAGAIMPYLTAGVAFAHASRDTTGPDYSTDATHVGWTAGLGVAIKATDNMAIDLQYRHSDFGTSSYDYGLSNPPDVALTQDAITVGVHFMM